MRFAEGPQLPHCLDCFFYPQLIQRGAEFENPRAGRFYAMSKWQDCRLIQKQNDAVEFAVAVASREGKAERMKKLAAAEIEALLEGSNDLLESLRSECGAVEKQKSKLPQDVARRVARENNVRVHLRKNHARVVLKYERQEFHERSAVGGLRAENSRRVFAPGELFSTSFAGQPAPFQENGRDIRTSKGIYLCSGRIW